MIKSIFGLLLILCLYLTGKAQQNLIKPYSVGDTILNYTVQNFYKEPARKIDLFDLRGKLVILDFWSVNCKACIASMPKMDSLQKKFGDKIQILLITYNNGKEIDNLFTKIKIKKPDLPIITDTILYSKYFPHEGDPLHVWIRPDGVIEHMTEAYNATEELVKNVLDGNSSPAIADRTFLKNFDRNKPFILQESVLSSSLESYSLLFNGLHLFKNIRGQRLSIIRDSILRKPIMIQAVNKTIYSLYNIAFAPDLFPFDPGSNSLYVNNRIIDETGESLLTANNKNEIDLWRAKNVFSYESRVKPSSGQIIYKIMQQDLNRYLDYVGTIEKRKVRCLVLVRTSDQDKIKTKGKETQGFESYDNGYLISNQPFSTLVRSLIYSLQNESMPIVDGTGYTGNIDIRFQSDLSNLSFLRKELRSFDLDLVEEVCEINMLIIRNKLARNPEVKQRL
jgi:thiol-disulfide isomerase/thioredoxin